MMPPHVWTVDVDVSLGEAKCTIVVIEGVDDVN